MHLSALSSRASYTSETAINYLPSALRRLVPGPVAEGRLVERADHGGTLRSLQPGNAHVPDNGTTVGGTAYGNSISTYPVAGVISRMGMLKFR